MLLAARAIEAAVEHVATDDFYKPANGHIFHAIITLHAAREPADPVTVAASLRQAGILDDVGGVAVLSSLHAGAPPTSNAGKYAAIIKGCAVRRRLIGAAGEMWAAAQDGDVDGALAIMEDARRTLASQSEADSWQEVDLQAVLDGDVESVVPLFMQRTDGEALAYPGKMHTYSAEPEAGKSWLALLAALQQIERGNHVMYVDFETDAVDIVGRLLSMGVNRDSLLTRFHYIRPDDPITASIRLRIQHVVQTHLPTIAVLDGVTEAMVMNGWSITNNDDVAKFFAMLPRLLAREGVAVLIIDHVTKDKENRGIWGIGGQHKLAGVDGAAFMLEKAKPFGKGQSGMSKLRAVKDKQGWVRRLNPGVMSPVVAELHVRDEGEAVKVELRPPTKTGDEGGELRPTHLMERVSRLLEIEPEPLGRNETLKACKGNEQYLKVAIKTLLAEGFVDNVGTEKKHAYKVIKPYREDEEMAEGTDNAEF